MAETYQDGTGTLDFRGEPRLSKIGAALLELVDTYGDLSGFFREDWKMVDEDDIREAIIRAEHPEFWDSVENQKSVFECDKEGFLAILARLGIGLPESYVALIGTDEVSPADLVAAIVDDPGSSLAEMSYEEATYCDQMRIGDFGGFGMYASRRVNTWVSTADHVANAVRLDTAIRGAGDELVEDLLAAELARVLKRVVDPGLRKQLAEALLAGQAREWVLDTVGDPA